ncbi:two-component sensor histidine kinase [Saccharopolyspora sp. HNM0983]|uniref:histidine kinase n=1 Tax=Saccharopolyspora montiporae TaxID=2781240 RepID=A0A929B7J5_9PSEU|nr:two-component sensor histidine kinase [Saccharopolyspora sp. HNM0983]
MTEPPLAQPREAPPPESPAQRLPFQAAAWLVRWVPVPVIALAAFGDGVRGLSDGGPLVLPGLALQVLLALLAPYRPLAAALGVLPVLVLQTAALAVTGTEVDHLGLEGIHPTENLVGLLVVFHVCRGLRLAPAVSATAALVLGCVFTSVLRAGVLEGPFPGANAPITAGFGLLQLVLVIGTALYLRGWLTGGELGPGRALLRVQWPVAAGLSILLFLDFVNYVGRTFTAVPLLLVCTVLMSALAVVAPRRPVQAALLGAVVPVLTTVGIAVLDGDSDGLLETAPLSTAASGALLIGYVIRHERPERAAWATGAVVLSGLVSITPLTNPRQVLGDVMYLAFAVMLLIIAAGGGWYLRARDAERARSVATAVSDAQQAERMALARELHDVVAHHVTGIVVQAQAAQHVAADNPQAAAGALGAISDSGSEALAAMRRLVGGMRGAETGPEHATTDLRADLRSLVQHAEQRKSGPHPDFQLDVRLPGPVPGDIGRSALRIVQEALTNVERHGVGVTSVRIRVRTDGGDLVVQVADDGRPARAQPLGGPGGYGLVGMRERVELLGGRFAAGPGGAGWCVEVVLPRGEDCDDPGTDRR